MSGLADAAVPALGAAGAPRRAHRRRTIRAGPAARPAARSPDDAAHGGRARSSSRSIRFATRSRTSSSQQVTRPDVQATRPGHGGCAVKATAAIAINVFRESVRDKVLYNLVVLRDPADRRVLPARPAHGRAGREDHQGPRPLRDVCSSACSSRCSSASAWSRRRWSAAASTACWPSRFTGIRSCSASTSGLTLTLAVNVAIMAAALYAVLAYMSWGIGADVQRAWDAPALDPALLKAIALIFVELMLVTAIALFFSTFSSPMLSAAFAVRLLRRRSFQRRPAQLRSGRRFASGRRRCARAVLGAAEPLARST